MLATDLDNDAKELLFTEFWSRYGRLVMHVLRKCVPKLDDDVLQVGRMALWEAICTYDPGRGMKFSSWLWRLVRLRVLEWRASAGYPLSLPYHVISSGKFPQMSAVSLHEFEAEREDWRIDPVELVYEERGYLDVQASVDRKLLVEFLRSRLTERQWYCLSRYFGLVGDEYLTLEVIARSLSASRQAVHCSIRTALDKLRNDGSLRAMLL